MAKYRTKPRETEAWQVISPVDTETTGAIPAWVIELIASGTLIIDETTGDGTVLNAQHGQVDFKDGDWLIFNGAEDTYPCIDDEFQKRYELVEE